MKCMSSTRLPSDEETQEKYPHAPGGCGREAANQFQTVVIPMRRVERMKHVYSRGEDIQLTVREEAGNQADVLSMAQSFATRQYIEELLMEVYGLLESAVESIRYALETETDAKLAYRLLVDLGVLHK